MRIDLHSHSHYSPDGSATVESVLRQAHKVGLDGIAITDHNVLKGSVEATKIDSPLLVVPAVEISTLEGHMVGLGITQEVPRGLSAVETAQKVRDLGGLPIGAHPFRRWTGLKARAILESKLEVIEGFNARSWSRNNLKSAQFAALHNLAQSGGSDAHFLEELGYGWVELPYRVEDTDGLIAALSKGDGVGKGIQRTFREVAGIASRNAKAWAGRGGKDL